MVLVTRRGTQPARARSGAGGIDKLRATMNARSKGALEDGLAHSSGDWTLLARSAAGEESAYADLVARHHDSGLALARHMLGDLQKAEDVLQKAFSNVYKHRARLTRKARFRTFFFRVVTNLCLKELARRRSAIPFSTLEKDGERSTMQAADPSASDPLRELEYREVDEIIVQALDRLRPEHRAALWLRENEGLSYQEIAEALEASLAEVKIWIHRARKKLMELLGPYLERGRGL